jgi:hypothetical protein
VFWIGSSLRRYAGPSSRVVFMSRHPRSDRQQLLVSQVDLIRGHGGIRAAHQVLAVQVGLVSHSGAVHPQQPALGHP